MLSLTKLDSRLDLKINSISVKQWFSKLKQKFEFSVSQKKIQVELQPKSSTINSVMLDENKQNDESTSEIRLVYYRFFL